ncbi:hypothetical protein [Paenibacillus agilis]|uniref:Uncharacterized protein n=1 Tax=Paenibacillus agilis TaxID=3020863 RepID=A0A559J1Y0_9BACL|nr:hypothetical protein [Paenibacillus agilis]TVX93898.1 hypothetical protein FPZ44_13040 [Paenibacillus agilis]
MSRWGFVTACSCYSIFVVESKPFFVQVGSRQKSVTEQVMKRSQSEWCFVNGDNIRIFVRCSGFSSEKQEEIAFIRV